MANETIETAAKKVNLLLDLVKQGSDKIYYTQERRADSNGEVHSFWRCYVAQVIEGKHQLIVSQHQQSEPAKAKLLCIDGLLSDLLGYKNLILGMHIDLPEEVDVSPAIFIEEELRTRGVFVTLEQL